MANLTICILLVTLVFASAQRNRPFPTTKQPAPTNPTTPTPSTTTPAPSQPTPYTAAGFRPGRAFELPGEDKRATEPTSSYGPPAREGRQYTPPPSVDPLPTYLPPSNKYGPPEGASTQKPESEPTTPRAGPQGRSLQNGFYFIRLPSGFISRTGLLTAAADTSDSATATNNEETEDVEVFEPSANPKRVAAAPPQVPLATVAQVQPLIQSQGAVQFWPPIKTERIVAAEPSVVVQSPQVLQPIVQTAEPLYYVQPQAYSYSSQYRSW